jgi:hypothetical protein
VTSRSTARVVLSRVTSRMACSELPPMSKKLSVAPTSPACSKPAYISASTASSMVAGATRPAAGSACGGGGSAARSIFPLALSGNSVTATRSAGIM